MFCLSAITTSVVIIRAAIDTASHGKSNHLRGIHDAMPSGPRSHQDGVESLPLARISGSQHRRCNRRWWRGHIGRQSALHDLDTGPLITAEACRQCIQAIGQLQQGASTGNDASSTAARVAFKVSSIRITVFALFRWVRPL